MFYRSVAPDQPGRGECHACSGRILPGNVTRWRAVLSPFGRCPACGTRIGPCPFSAELATALVLAAVFGRSSSAWQALALAWLRLNAIPLACIDLAVKRLPDALTGPAFAGTMVLLSAAAVASRKPLLIAHVVLAAAVLAALYLAITLIWLGGIGFGGLSTELRRRSPQAAEVTERGCFPRLRAMGAGLDVSIAAAGQKLQAMDQLTARHQVTHLGMPDFGPAVGRSSTVGGGP